MKANYILCAAGLSVLFMSGCGIGESRMSYLGIEEAKRLALQEAGFSESEVKFTETDLSSRNGTDYYEVDFTAAGKDYEYEIDALTGVIIDADVPLGETADRKANTNAGNSAESNGSTNHTKSSGNADQSEGGNSGKDGNTGNSNAGSSQNDNTKMLTEEEAKAKALAHAGLANDQVTFVKSKQDYEDGHQIYEIEFYSADGKEYDYEIDVYTGEVLSFDYDAESYTPSSGGTMITVDAARELALSQIPGASEQDMVEFEVDYDDGHTEYEGKIIYNGMEYEFEIDAYSGTFRSWETEPVDD